MPRPRLALKIFTAIALVPPLLIRVPALVTEPPTPPMTMAPFS